MHSQCILQMLIYLHDRCLVTASVTVVGSTEDRDHIPVLTPIVALHDQLVSPCDQGQTVVMIECLGYVLSECVACTSRTDSPTTSVIRITPQQIAHGPFVRYLLNSVQRADVVECVNARGEAAMQTEDLIVDQSGERKVVEQVREELPDICVAVLSQAFVVEPVDLRNLARLVVTS